MTESVEPSRPYSHETTSICPVCMDRIPATIKEVEGEDLVIMEKTCPEHGKFEDKIATDKELYIASQKYVKDGSPDASPQTKIEKGCPFDCGICEGHKSAPSCIVVDVTNRCNLNCPICYANANKKGMIVEWTFDEIMRIYRHYLTIEPKPPVIAMMAGGEPTIRDDLPEIIKELANMGYRQVQIATNGIRLAKDIDYYRRCLEAAFQPGADCGIVMYMQFDGIKGETYKKTRGVDIFHYKEKVIANAKELLKQGVISSGICLVVTVTKDNLDEVPAVIEFAADNIDVVSGIMFQPVAFCGRVTDEELKEYRVTTYDVIKKINQETNDVLKPWRPFPAYHELMNMIAKYNGDQTVEFTCNPQCGFVTFLNCRGRDENGVMQYGSVQEMIEMGGGIDFVHEKWEELNLIRKRDFFKSFLGKYLGQHELGDIIDSSAFWLNKQLIKGRFIAGGLKFIDLKELADKDKRPSIVHALDIMFRPSWWTTRNFLVKGRNLYVGVMHFQDPYDLDTERVKRCVVHYGLIDPEKDQIRAYPFCTFNPIHRDPMEKKIADQRGKPLGKVELVEK